MTKALPRKYRGQDAEARSAARAEARRSGKRLGAWLDDAGREDEDAFEDDDADDAERVEAAARRLARPGGGEPRRRRDEDEPPRRWRDEAKGRPRRQRDDFDEQPRRSREEGRNERRRREEFSDAPPRRRHADEDAPRRWRDEAEDMRAPLRARRDSRFDADEEMDDDGSRRGGRRLGASWRGLAGFEDPVDPEAIVADAAAIVGRRIAESERHTARALDNLAGLVEDGARSRETAEEGLAFLARRLGRIESRLAEQPSAGDSVRPIRSALARLESRLERLSGADRVAHVEEALDGLDRRLADIASRLDASQARERTGPPPAPEAPAPARPEPPRRPESFARRPLEESVAEIARRQRALDAVEAPAAPPTPSRPPAPAPARMETAARMETPARMEAPEPAPSAKHLAAVHARLDTIAQQLETARRDASERADHHLVVMRQVEALRRDLAEMAGAIVELAPRASIASIETALHHLSRRIETQRDQGVAEDLLAPAERIAGELRIAMKELDPSPLVRNLHADVQAIGRRLDALQQPGAIDPAAVELLVGQTAEIRTQLAGLAARPLPLEKIEARLVDLTQRVELLTRAAGNAAKAAVAFDMGEVARSIRAIVAEETSSSFDTFSGRLETLAAKLDGVVAEAGAKRFDEIGKRIDDLGHKLATRIAASAAQAPPPLDTSSLENLVAGLAKKLDTALDHPPHAPVIEEIGRKLEALETRLPDQRLGFEEIGRKLEALETRLPNPETGFAEIGKRIGRIERRLPDPAAAESIARIEAALARPQADQRFADLAQRIDGVRETLAQKLEQGAAVPKPEIGAIEKLVRGLDRKVETALAARAAAPDMEPIRSQLEQLSQKVDRLDDPSTNRLGALLTAPTEHPKLDEIASRLDHMQMALARRADDGARVEARQAELTDLVEQLAARMNQAVDPRGDAEALRALERQISALSQRLDRSDHNGAALSAVEEKIGALVAQIEETKTATTLAAEEAIRRATQDILREASPDAEALRAAIERELSDIRNIQDESGQRTHETLLAVHETLERVVDRLAMFEDELTEIRAAPPAPAIVRPPVARPPKPVEMERAPEAAPLAPRAGAPDPGDLTEILSAAFGPQPATDRPQTAEAAVAPEASRPESAQMDFIAAARRAAQQAARDAQAAERAHMARRAATVAENAAGGEARSAGKASGLAALIQERKRPLLLGLGALVLMAGAYQIARIGIDGAETWRQGGQHAEISPGDGEATAPAPAPKADRRAPKGSVAPALPEPEKVERPQAAAPTPAPTPRMIAPRADNAPLDKTPVGSISPGALNPLSPQEAVNVIRTLAEQGSAAAQFELALRSAEGRGAPRDPKAAAQWFEKAAAQGLAPAQYRLGSLYEKGVGVERDPARARKLYLSAAQAGNARAMHNLAVMLAEGGDNGKPDYGAASEWFRKAGEAGVRDSQYNLAILYARGLGLPQSLTQSYVWFAAAAAQGDADADKKREEVGARLDSRELAAAKAAAAAFRVKEPPREANEVAPPAGGWENIRLPTSGPKPPSRPKVSMIRDGSG